MRLLLLAAAFLVGPFGLVPAGQTGAVVSGFVFDDAGQALGGAVVALSREGDRQTVNTTENGAFSFTAVTAGRARLSASKPGHVTSEYGAIQPDDEGTPLVVAAGLPLTGLRIVLPRQAVIAGTVSMPSGAGSVDTRVSAVAVTPAGVVAVPLRQWTTRSDESGRYRLAGLLPGAYVVFATVSLNAMSDVGLESEQSTARALQDLQRRRDGLAGRSGLPASAEPDDPAGSAGVATTFYPGTTAPRGAVAVTLAAGQQQAGIDFRLIAARNVRVSGRLPIASNATRSDGRPLLVELLPADPLLRLEGAQGATAVRALDDGRFLFRGVPAGDYLLRADAGDAAGGPDGRRWAEMPLALIEGQANVEIDLPLRPDASVAGTVVNSGGADDVGGTGSCEILLSPTEPVTSRLGLPRAWRAPIARGGRFNLGQIWPGQYVVDVACRAPADWVIESVAVGSRFTTGAVDVGAADIGDLNIVVSRRPTRLFGRVEGIDAATASTLIIIAFTSDPSTWQPWSKRLRTARPASDGSYVLEGLPPGDYELAVVAGMSRAAVREPAFLTALGPAAVAVRIASGAAKELNLRIGG